MVSSVKRETLKRKIRINGGIMPPLSFSIKYNNIRQVE
nr:MAG TPA: hypothetical protein [Caudoviricetes sp.]